MDGGSRHPSSTCRRITALGSAAFRANLEPSRLVEKLDAIAPLDLDELLAIDPPRGYGRD